MSSLPSNIHVFVTFKEDAVFAGETIEATITFRNVEGTRATTSLPSGSHSNNLRPPPTPTSKASYAPSRPTISRTASISSQQAPRIPPNPQRLGHRPALSLQTDPASVVKVLATANGTNSDAHSVASTRTPTHGRSVSIVSLGNEAGEDRRWGTQITRVPARPGAHRRSSSLQVTPVLRPGTRTPSVGDRMSPRWRSPSQSILPMRYQSAESYFAPQFRPSNGRDGLGISGAGVDSPAGDASPATSQNLKSFRFPADASGTPPRSSPQRPGAPDRTQSTSSATPRIKPPPFRPLSPRISEDRSSQTSQQAPLPLKNKALSLASSDETSRNSMDFYSQSNNSDEDSTASEYPLQASQRLLPQRPPFSRAPSNLGPNSKTPRQPETIMMGYAQISGSFMLDGSLANQAPFEEVKRKAVMGGQGGGGVVGIEQRKSDGGLFGSFGWGAIGESLGGLLHSGEMSSMKEMRGIASSENVPLLSTPKSILFVDLTLAPGESKSYSYTFTLPRGLPPSHKGRAMKVAYNLVIGTQRPAAPGKKQLQMRQAEIPFRVFGGVNTRGDNIGHDLMSPYLILRDQAKTSLLEPDHTGALKPAAEKKPKQLSRDDVAAAEADFQSYVTELLTRPRRLSSAGLLSPSDIAPDALLSPLSPTESAVSPTRRNSNYLSHRRLQSTFPAPTMRALVDFAILRSTQPLPNRAPTADRSPSPGTSAATSPTHFTIARSGAQIATLVLSRPFLRLGDTLHFVLDFAGASVPTYAADVTLESLETVDAALALRSEASVERATRRVWDRAAADALPWARRWAAAVKVPWNATPGFTTSGVGCEWVVRIEIVVGKGKVGRRGVWRDWNEVESEDEDEEKEEGRGSEEEEPRGLNRAYRFLRRVADDDRGATYRATSMLQAESFEIAVPIRVFGAVGAGVTVAPEERDRGLPV